MDVSNNVVTYLQRSAQRVGDRVALVLESDDGQCRQISFAELWDQVDRVSVGLRRAGLAPSERVIIMIPMSIDLYVTLLAVLKAGAVAVFVDPWIGGRQIAAFAAFASPTAYLGIAKSHLLRLLSPQLRRISLSVTTGRRFWRIPARRSLSEVTARDGDGQVHPVAADDPALITFTTGSSGTPKGTNRTHGFLTAQHEALQHEFPYRDDDVDMPMFPVFALNNLASGITSIVPRMDFRHVAEVDGTVIVDQMKRHGVTTSTASPPFFDRIVGSDQRPALRRLLTGGAPVSDQQLMTWGQALPDTEVTVVYGSTEAEPVAHIDAVDRLSVRSDCRPKAPGFCVGKPTPLIRTNLVRIEDGPVTLTDGGWDGRTVEPGEIGELVVAGRHVCRDYFQNPEAVRENKIVDAEGTVWHRMGDTGYFDGDGRFWLVGRVHSTILRDGSAVHPQLVEQAARGGDERIRRAAAVGVGNRVVVVVEADADPTLREAVVARLTAAEQPFDDIVVSDDPLPVDPRHNSKIDYDLLRNRLQG